jgi:formate dehydrogenase subunit gamma
MTPLADDAMTHLRVWAWAIGGTMALLAVFFLLRGRIRIEKGWGGFNVPRFGRFERIVHWLLALSFVVALITGLTMLLGRLRWGHLVVTLPGGRGATDLVPMSERVHFLAGMAFVVCLPLACLAWARHSLPRWRDAVWAVKGGGILLRGRHPPAHKFNLSQKLMFWLTMVGGALLSFTGTAMLLPGLIEQLPLHSLFALVLACAVVIHIYLRTIGIQGAVSAMISGEVDANWARQHHSLWAEAEVRRIEESAGTDAAETAAVHTP